MLLGYNRGDYRWHRMVTHYTVGAGFDGSKGGLQGSDWARLELDGAIPALVAPLPIATEPPRSGVAIAVAGYNQDRAQILMADLACHITGTAMAAGKLFIAHDCDATGGTSGGPLLVRQGGGWAVIGINIGAAAETNLALPATAFANRAPRGGRVRGSLVRSSDRAIREACFPAPHRVEIICVSNGDGLPIWTQVWTQTRRYGP